LYPLLRARTAAIWAAAACSLAFALPHAADRALLPLMVVLGGSLAMCQIYEKWRSLWLCAGLHAAFNGFNLLARSC
jgi:membrane protease YdiL (CAAX protease family)